MGSLVLSTTRPEPLPRTVWKSLIPLGLGGVGREELDFYLISFNESYLNLEGLWSGAYNSRRPVLGDYPLHYG